MGQQSQSDTRDSKHEAPLRPFGKCLAIQERRWPEQGTSAIMARLYVRIRACAMNPSDGRQASQLASLRVLCEGLSPSKWEVGCVTAASPFQESRFLATPIRELGLTITDTPLHELISEFQRELERVGIRRLKPDFYLSTEWGVPFESISIGIPFYLAQPELVDVHARHVGHLEGVGRAELLRYLRHEMGHVVNYAYRLYEQAEWIRLFGSITQPYLEEYRPEPFSQRYVTHLPGWYAQKHPDEDWSETFAVWMTPGLDWRATYANWPDALAKLEYCDRTMAGVNERDPLVTTTDRDEEVSSLTASLEDFYRVHPAAEDDSLPPDLDGSLRVIFEDFGSPENHATDAPRRSAAELIRHLERDVVANVYRWTGHFPEMTRRLVQHLATRAETLRQVYPADHESSVTVALTTLVTSLAMNHVLRGHYLP